MKKANGLGAAAAAAALTFASGAALAETSNPDPVKIDCHKVKESLTGVAERYRPGELRSIFVNSKAVFGDKTIMPGFHVTRTGARVTKNSRA